MSELKNEWMKKVNVKKDMHECKKYGWKKRYEWM